MDFKQLKFHLDLNCYIKEGKTPILKQTWQKKLVQFAKGCHFCIMMSTLHSLTIALTSKISSHYEFIGKKNCHQRSELAGWVTCIDTDPTSGLNNNEKKQVQDMKLLSPSLN